MGSRRNAQRKSLDAKTLRSVARELRQSAKTHAELATKQGSKEWFADAHEWQTSARMLHFWADHFDGQAERCRGMKP